MLKWKIVQFFWLTVYIPAPDDGESTENKRFSCFHFISVIRR